MVAATAPARDVLFMGENGIMETTTTSASSSAAVSSSSSCSAQAGGSAPAPQPLPRGNQQPQAYAFYRPPTKRLYRKLEGWLWKKGPNGVISGWKRRYFYLRDNRLYYAVDTQADPINYILLTA